MKTPLAVDLDGTLINTDLFFESAVWFLRKNPFRFFQMCWWFFTKGRAELKIQIEKRAGLSIPDLPFNHNVIQWLKEEKEKGRELVLVTGASQKYAEQAAEYLGLFSQVFGVCRKRPRLTGKNKARFLLKMYGAKNFDYIGNSVIDLAVWKQARECIIANAFVFVKWIAQKKFSKCKIISESFSIKENWSLFNILFSVLALRICILGIAFIFFAGWLDANWTWEKGHFMVFPLVILFYFASFLMAELKNLGPNRILKRKGIFMVVHPYWALLSVFLAAALFYLLAAWGFLWWFLIYFVLEYLRWTFRKYSIYFDIVLSVFLCFFAFASS